ncbi:TonB-dependent receptor domain-containing protein [Hirschia baltica]|uniref:TonB-dependent receptor plug n=1 Tax=Hirschia baltica (strain ATCC 49814 / DSM 5838 / IFAM 1418) TaxID=582402 RepID=C6XJ74_HIRBI|nr:TonB-dependent receptor [Hirschia baltica]ACT59169.1 TonB-dependent receptor plug [Hirschia baltica ATCC 49814]
MIKKLVFQSATAMAVALAAHQVASAQEIENTSAQVSDGEFLGTLTLGESKRDVQTDTATPVTTIDQEEIEDRQAGTIAELIDSVPGVSLVNGSTPSGSGINIRGFGANGTYGTDQKVAIQIDGASVGSEELYRIGTQLYTDPALFKSVDVIRGTVGSFEYGSGIVGGVVKLTTIDASDMIKDNKSFGFRQTLGYASNGNGFNSSSTLALQPTEGFELLGNFSWKEQEIQTDGSGNDITNTEFELPSYLLKAKYSAGSHSLAASYTQSNSTDRDVPYDSFGLSGGGFGNVDRDISTQSASLTYNYAPEENDLIDLDVILTYANQEIDQESVNPGGFAVINADHQYETTKLTVKNTFNLGTESIDHDLRIGAEIIQKDRLDASSAPGGTDDRVALFLVDTIDLLNGWSFSPAVRYETSTIDGTLNDDSEISYENDALMGGASLRYEFSSGFALFGSYAHTENLPILDDLENAVYMEQPEVADTYEIGTSYDRSNLFTENDNLSFKLNYFDTTLEDVTSYSGVTEVGLTGFELETSYALSSGFYSDLNATIFDADETTSSGNQVDWRNSIADNVRFTLGKRFGRLIDVSGEIVAVDELDTNGTIDTGYVTANLRTTITPQNGFLEGSSLRIGLENALDQKYTPAIATRPAIGRNLKVTISKAF